MKYLLLLVALASLLAADTLTVTATQTEFPESTDCQFDLACLPVELDVPEFNPALGSLVSISYQFSADQIMEWMWEASPPDSFTIDLTQGVSSSNLGIAASAMQAFVDTDNIYESSGFEFPYGAGLSSSGTVTDLGDLEAFTGTGTTAELIQPFGSTIPTEDDGVYAQVEGITQSSMSLTVTYNYVPEPRWAVVMLAVAIITTRWRAR